MIEKTILSNLVFNEEYTRTVLPFLKKEYFHQAEDAIVFELIESYVNKYNGCPTKEAVLIELGKLEIPEILFEKAGETIDDLSSEGSELEWLIDKSEEFCQDKALSNAVMTSIDIIQGDSKLEKGEMTELLKEALSVSFDKHIGHDYIEDMKSRFDFLHAKEETIPFSLKWFNNIFGGGLYNKTLNVILATTGGGKSLFMCNEAAYQLSIGKNVLYITLEMAEERIASRIDANLMQVELDELPNLHFEEFTRKIHHKLNKGRGRLVIKEYPTGSAHVNHFRHLLRELKLKQEFVPDIIFVDYINICASSRIKAGSQGSYYLIKSIAEELRGLAVEYDLPVVTATQVNRGGMDNSDIEMTDIAESVGLPQTADTMFALISSEELEQRRQIMVKQLKNRFGDPNKHKKFVIGIDRARMSVYDVDDTAQENISSGSSVVDPDHSVFDNSTFGNRLSDEKKAKIARMFD